MKRIHTRSAATLLVLVMMAVTVGAESGPPQHQLKVYELSGNPHSADISPNETLAATEITRLDSTNAASDPKSVELAQLWDFRQERLIAEVPLTEVVTDKEQPSRDLTPRFIRFTADGKLVVVYFEHFLYVLSGDDLREVRRVPMNGPPDVTDSFTYKSQVHVSIIKPHVELLEISPIGHTVVTIWDTGRVYTQADVYDLDTGKLLSEWMTYGPLKGLAWEANSRQLVFAVPNDRAIPFLSNEPQIDVVDAFLGVTRVQLYSDLWVGGIAVTPDDRAWVVDFADRGLFANHAPKMKVFDLHTGKLLRNLSGRESGVRYAVAASRTGDRVVAYTGKMKDDFDWGDMVANGADVDRTFSVWNSKNYAPIVTSQDLTVPRKQQEYTRPNQETLRISPKGGFVLFGSNIYELP